MNSSKHDKGDSPFADDLKSDPGIGQSKGTTMAGADSSEIEGENTVEGDIANDVGPNGEVNPRQRGRTGH